MPYSTSAHSAGRIHWYKDPNGKTDYTWDKAGRLTELLDPAGKKTTYEYNNNDKRTKTTYPGGTTQSITLDASNRPTAVKAVSGTTTLVDLAYTYTYGTGGTTDGTKIRTRKDNTTQVTTTYGYDSQGRLNRANPQKTGEPSVPWTYSYDKAGNLLTTSTIGSTSYGYNDASKDGVSTGWSYDKTGNETAAAPAGGTARTGEIWTDHGQLKSITTAGTTRALTHAGTDNTERTELAGTTFHHTALGLTGTTTAGADTGFIREPAGTLNSVRNGGKSSYYLTDATGNVIGLVDEAGKRTHTYAYTPTAPARTRPKPSPSPTATPAPTWIPPVCTRWAPATTTPPSAASPSPTPPARKRIPTSTPSAIRSTTPTPPDCRALTVRWTPSVTPVTSSAQAPIRSRETRGHCGAMLPGSWWEDWPRLPAVQP